MAHTHQLTFAGPVLTKRFTSWSRGEHHREWTVLRLAHRHAPDLVPAPIAAKLDADPPTVTMSRLPGEPLTRDVTPAQRQALATAIKELWLVPLRSAEPASALPTSPTTLAAHPEATSVTAVGDWADDLPFARRLTAGPRPPTGITADAYDAALAWWHGPDPELLRTPPATLVLGHRDPNLANYLWDGARIRIVDFEDAGPSDPATELAILAEHLSARDLDLDDLITRFPAFDESRFRAARRVFAMLWLRLLLSRRPAPAGGEHLPDPPGVAESQAARLLTLLG